MRFSWIQTIFLITVAFHRYGRCSTNVVSELADYSLFDFGVLPKALRLIHQCGQTDMLLCLKERTLEYVDSVNSQDYKIIDGVYLKRTNESVTKDEINRESIPEDATARSSRLNELLFEKALNFLKTRVLEIRVPDETIDSIEQTSDESRKKKKKEMIPLILMMKMKAAVILHMVMKAIAIMSFKAIMMAKIALVISIAIALKKLSHQSEHRSFAADNNDLISSVWHYMSEPLDAIKSTNYFHDGHNLAYSAHHNQQS